MMTLDYDTYIKYIYIIDLKNLLYNAIYILNKLQYINI